MKINDVNLTIVISDVTGYDAQVEQILSQAGVAQKIKNITLKITSQQGLEILGQLGYVNQASEIDLFGTSDGYSGR
mgnify:FL=1